MALGSEYSSDYAYFIAGGRTLDIIKEYEDDAANPKARLAEIAKEYGALELSGYSHSADMTFDREVSHPALTFSHEHKGKWIYDINPKTPEGSAILDRIDDIPQMELTQRIFARRLTGEKEVPTNPDNVQEKPHYNSGHYSAKSTATAATFTRYGDTYVVSVPRTIHAVYDDASREASLERRFNIAAGYQYDWFTPPDSLEIPYSKVIELREQSLGDQLARREVKKLIPAIKPRKD